MLRNTIHLLRKVKRVNPRYTTRRFVHRTNNNNNNNHVRNIINSNNSLLNNQQVSMNYLKRQGGIMSFSSKSGVLFQVCRRLEISFEKSKASAYQQQDIV